MKTKQLIAVMALCGPLLFTNVKAQGLYFGLGVGYGFPAAKQAAYDQTSTNTGSVNTSQYTAKDLSLGKGVNVGLMVGYMFNKNIGAELGINYLIGSKTELEDNYTSPSYTDKSIDTYSGKMLRFIPALRMTVGEGKMRPYMKMGLIIGVGSKFTHEYNSTYTDLSGTSTGQEITEYTGGISWGLHGGLGVSFALSEKLNLFGEIAGNYQNWAPKKSEITTSTADGIDLLPFMTTSEKETEFLEEVSYNNSTPENPGVPSQSPKSYLPFSSIGINIGLTFTLGGGADK